MGKLKDLNEHEIQKILGRQYMTNPAYLAENLYVFKWESDFLFKTRSGYWHEVEIKISFSDFKNDAKNKKEKFEILETGELRAGCFKHKRPNYFSYCVTENLVEKVKPLLPEYAGLYYVDEAHHRLINVKAPTKLHSEKIPDEALKLTEKFYYNYREWKRACERWYDDRAELQSRIRILEAEYKAATGSDFNEAL